MRSLLYFSIIIFVGLIIQPSYALSTVSYRHQLTPQNIAEHDRYLDKAEKPFLDIFQDSDHDEISSEHYETTLLPRGNCIGKPCTAETDQRSRSARSSSPRLRTFRSTEILQSERSGNQDTVTGRDPSSNESVLRRISPPWPSLPRTSGPAGRNSPVSKDRSSSKSSLLDQFRNRSPVSGPRARSRTDSNLSLSRTASGSSSSTSVDDINDKDGNIFPWWVHQTASNRNASPQSNRRSASGKTRKPEISAVMKGPGAMFAKEGVDSEWMGGVPKNAVVHRVEKGQIMEKTWSHHTQLSGTFVTGKGGSVSVQAMGRFVEGTPFHIANNLPTVVRKPGRAILQSWRPPLGKEIRQPSSAIRGKRATFTFPNFGHPELSNGVLASSAGHKSEYQAGLSASAEGRMLLEIDARKRDIYWPDAKKSYAHRWYDLDHPIHNYPYSESE